jgi:hypothetical protein
MIIECGPDTDRRIFTLQLPTESKRIGVLVSGGMDSALLYFLVMLENRNIGDLHEIVAYTIPRNDGSKLYALPIIRYIGDYFNKPQTSSILVGNTTLPEINQVSSGLYEIRMNHNTDMVYVGVIETLPMHGVGVYRQQGLRETHRYKIPMKDLNKSHVVDLILRLNQEILFNLTHGCLNETGRCGICGGCLERTWGFEQMSIVDTGII